MTKTCGTCIHCSTTYDGEMGFCRGKDYAERTDSVEQLARDMLAAITAIHTPCNEDRCCSLSDYGWPEGLCAYDFDRRLEALGVEV